LIKKISILLVSILVFSILGNKFSNVFAVESLEVVEVTPKSTSVTLSWEDSKADSFIVENENGKKYWKGESKKYKIKDLTPNRMYKLKITSRKNGKTIDTATILTKTEKSNKKTPTNRRQKIEQAKINAVLKKGSIKLFWDSLPNDKTEYVIKKNGEEVGRTKSGEFKDENVNIEEYVKYEVVGYLQLPKEKLKEQKEIISKQPFKLTKKEKEKLSSDQFTLSLSINSKHIPKVNDNNVSASTYEPGYALFYTTFIPQPFLKAPKPYYWFHEIKYYDGDGRWNFGVFDWTEPYGNKLERNFRTRTIMKVKFPSNKLPVVDFDKYISKTHGRDKDFNIVASKRDKTANIYYKVRERTTNFVEFYVYHDSRNGLLPGTKPTNYSPYITYDYIAAIDKDGYLSMTGQHDLMPSHEVYLTSYPGDFDVQVYTQHMWNPFMLFATNEFGPQGYINSNSF
jgi:hypothetical protein